MRALSSFHHNCLRQICNIFWPNTITNTNLLHVTNSKCIIDEITQKRFRWLGHVLRMEGSSITKTVLRWTPQGKQPIGSPETTWHRTVEGELKDLKITFDFLKILINTKTHAGENSIYTDGVNV